jgi:hypothetical protein
MIVLLRAGNAKRRSAGIKIPAPRGAKVFGGSAL